MFQYAAGRAAALRSGATLLLDASALIDPARPFALSGLALRAELLSPSHAGDWVELQEAGFAFDPRVARARPGTRLDGFFQSERYFADQADAIRAELAPAAQPSKAYQDLAAAIERSPGSVSVHVRRGDYARDPHSRAFHGVLEAGYYVRALEEVAARTSERPDIFLFSDEPAEALALLGEFAPLTAVQTAAPWEDLHLMARCRSHIGANSSFSWWGAWLDPRPGKLVIAPRRWASPEAGLDTADLHPAGVILV